MIIKKDLIKREIAGDTILVPVGQAVYEANGLFALNEVAAFIWDMLPLVETEEEILARVLAEYDVDESTAIQDIWEFMDTLKKMEIV